LQYGTVSQLIPPSFKSVIRTNFTPTSSSDALAVKPYCGFSVSSHKDTIEQPVLLSALKIIVEAARTINSADVCLNGSFNIN
jgi:hypothetical protein